MVFKSRTDLTDDDLLGARPRSPPYLGSTSSPIQSLKERCEQQELELQRSKEKTQEAMMLAAENTAKARAAEETIKSLTAQVESLRKRCELQELELQRSTRKSQEAVALAAEEAAKLIAAKEIIKSLTAQLEGRAPDVGVGDEWIEQYEPGVYVTLVALQDGTREIKRVRFSRSIFKEQQAETWWSENRGRVYNRYNVRSPDGSLHPLMS